MTAIHLEATDPLDGCTRCGTPRTVQLHPHHGRLCPHHAVPPAIPPGRYRRWVAEDLVDCDRLGQAFAYLADALAAEVDRRFDEALVGAGLSCSAVLW